MSRMTRTLWSAGLISMLLAAGPAVALPQDDLKSDIRPIEEPSDAQVQLRNESKWSIQQLFFAPIDSDRWGPDQLDRHSVRMGDTFTLTGLRCDKYDVKIVDEDGDECIVRRVALCADTKVWTLTDNDLLKCQSRTPQ